MREFIAAMKRVPVDAMVLAGALTTSIVAIGCVAVPIARAFPIVTPADAVAPVVKLQARFVPDLQGDSVPHADISKLFCRLTCDAVIEPIEPVLVEPVIFRDDPLQKGKQKKRSAIDEDGPSFQLASLSPNIPDDIETKPTTLRTPFGTNITTRVSLDGIPSELTDFLRKVQTQCGKVTVISGYRKTGIPGTCHARRQAVDYQIDDPDCALRVAQTFRGGHSKDYRGVQRLSRSMPAHFHASICPREMGVRFVHRGGVSRVRSARVASRHYGKRRHVRVARSAEPPSKSLWP